MTHPRKQSADRKPVLPGGNLPDFLVWPVLAIIPLMCLVGSWSTPPVATPDELKSATSQVLLTALLLMYYWHIRKQPYKLHLSAPTWAFAALFLLGTASVFWSVNPDFWFYKWSRWFAGCVMFLFALQIRQNTANLDRVFNACLAAGVITAVVGILQQLFFFSVIPQTAFPASTFGNGNVAGEVMIFTFPLGLYFLCKPDLSRRATWVYAAAVCLIAMYTFYTRTRAVWLAVILETCLVSAFILLDKHRQTWWHWNRTKTNACVVMFLIFLVMINFSYRGFEPFWQVAIYEMTSIVVDMESTQGSTTSARYLIWDSALAIIKDHPWFGTGVGSFFEVINNGGYNNIQVLGVQRVHNDVLELAVDLGLAGLVCLTLIIVVFCRQLLQLIIHSRDKHRLVYMLLTVAVTGSMLEAQLAFPYELPVPLVIMPLYMALVIRGAEHVVPTQVRYWRPGTWFNHCTVAGTAAMLVVVTFINGQWLADFRQQNRILSNFSVSREWQPQSWIYSQAHITSTRSIVDALKGINQEQVALNILKPVLAYWPDAVAHTVSMAALESGRGNLLEAESWAQKTRTVQPAGTYLGELFLLNIYSALGANEKALEIYNLLINEPEDHLLKYSNTLNTLHYNSIIFSDVDNTQRFYDLYIQQFGEVAGIEANHAVFLLDIGQLQPALTHMSRALELDPGIAQAEQFHAYLAEYGVPADQKMVIKSAH